MSKSLYSVDMKNLNNKNTLYEDIIKPNVAPDLCSKTLNNTKILRNLILSMIKDFIKEFKTVKIKEFSNRPPMIYDYSANINDILSELTTDNIIVNNAFTQDIIEHCNKNFDEKYVFSVEALDMNNVSVARWDSYLNELFFYYGNLGQESIHSRVSQIIIENTITSLKKWRMNEGIFKPMVETYLHDKQVFKNDFSYWESPLIEISKSHWEKFSFAIVIQDYEIYSYLENKFFLDYISDKLIKFGMIEEIIVQINHFFWKDDLQTIFNWLEKNTHISISFRIMTVSNIDKNTYLRNNKNVFDTSLIISDNVEELEFMSKKLPLFLYNIIQKNIFVCGFELKGGYFGREGHIPNMLLGSEEFDKYKDIIKKILNTSPFGTINDDFSILFDKPIDTKFICLRSN